MGLSVPDRRVRRSALRTTSRGIPLVAGLLFAPGCLIDEPPDLSAPTPRAPQPLIESAVPPINQPFLTQANNRGATFQVRYLPDKTSDGVVAFLFLNYLAPNERFLGQTESSAPVEGSDALEIAVAWTNNNNELPGCYSVTMAITYDSNVIFDDLRTVIIDDPQLTSVVTWWVAHDIEPQNLTLDECYPPALSDTEDPQ
jgi:hypothetical protein